jgi:hypothetical protein
MQAARFSETLLIMYQSTWRDVLEDLILQQHSYENFKSSTLNSFFVYFICISGSFHEVLHY